MSYILDALRKAEVERERQKQAVPGIHDSGSNQPVYLAYEGSSNSLKWWGAGAALCVVLGAAYIMLSRGGLPISATPQIAPHAAPPVEVAPTAQAPLASGSAPVPLQAAPALERPPVAQVALNPATMQAKVSAPTVAPAAPQQPALRTDPPLPSPATASVRPPAAAIKTPIVPSPAAAEPRPLPTHVAPPAPATNLSTNRSASPPPVPAIGSAAKPGLADIPLFSDLPDHIRKQVPAISVAGAVVSESTREWALLVNDKVLTPGSLVAADLYLVDISANSAVFNYRGQKFRLDR